MNRKQNNESKVNKFFSQSESMVFLDTHIHPYMYIALKVYKVSGLPEAAPRIGRKSNNM